MLTNLRRIMSASAGGAVVLKISSAALNYLGVVVVSSALLRADFGIYGTIMSGLVFASAACRLGANTSIIRFLGEYRAHDRPDLQSGAIFGITRFIRLVCFGVAALGALALYIADWSGWPGFNISFVLALLLLVPFTSMEITSSVIRSYGGIGLALGPREVVWRAAIVLIGLLAHLVPWENGRLPFIVLFSSLSLIGLSLFQWAKLRSLLPVAVRTAIPAYDWPKWRRTSSVMWMSQIARVSFRTLDVVIVGIMLSPAVAAIYFAAARTSEFVSFLLNSINLIVGPETAMKHATGDKGELERFLAVAAIGVFVPAAITFVMLLLGGRFILGLFGSDFDAAYWPLIILSAGHLVNSAAGSVSMVLSMTGNERTNAKVLMATAPITWVAMILGASSFGIYGVALGSSFGMTLWNLWLYLSVRRIGYDPSIIGSIRYFYRFR